MENTNKNSCFISAHDGFHGIIKKSTGDFIVTEINIDGQLVNTEVLLKDSPPLDGSRNCGSEFEHEPKESLLIPQRCDMSAYQGTDEGNEWSDPTYLQRNLNAALNDELEKFAMEIRLRPHVKSGENPVPEELSLGMFLDKSQRATMHHAVRNKYPHLMTLTSKNEIIVKEDCDYKELSQMVSEEESQGFFRFIHAKVSSSVFTFKPDNSKQHRKAVHHFLSKRFGKLLETKSFPGNPGHGLQGPVITVRFREKNRTARKRRASDSEMGVMYTAFVLKKENLETLEAVSYMSAALGVLPSDFTYAGIKDKRAITYQSMVVKKVFPERLKEKSVEFQKKGIHVSHIRPVCEPLHLGKLQGNHFDVVVREVRPKCVDHTKDLAVMVQEAVSNTKMNGFVNYYGPQRFGTGQSCQADQIGKALLRNDMVTAVKVFFTPEEGQDDPQNKAKRLFLQTGRAKESLALMPERKAREGLLLRALHRYGAGPEGCARAWLSLPHSMRVFYAHAYCSRVWNDAASYRLQQLGRRAVQGDLVWERGGPAANPRQIHVVSAAEEIDGVYTLGQVVLPMPGNTVKYPENIMATWYKERLDLDGLQKCQFRVNALKLNLPGCYRPLLAVPQNVTHVLHRCDGAQCCEREQDCSSPHHPTLSLALSFDLDSSCYATVCLREIMKWDYE